MPLTTFPATTSAASTSGGTTTALYKPSTTARGSGTVLSLDPHLQVPITALGTYVFNLSVAFMSGASTTGITVLMSYTGTSTNLYTYTVANGNGLTISNTISLNQDGAAPNAIVNSTYLSGWATASGWFTATTAGTFGFSWTLAGGSSSSVLGGSTLSVTRTA